MKRIFLIAILYFVAQSLSAQGVKITHNLPLTMKDGQVYDVEYTVDKGNIGSFAKFQVDLPIGFEATNIDSKGGNFTYEGHRVKIVWVSFPTEPTFTFKFKIKVPTDGVNVAILDAKLYYLESNVKKEYEVPRHTITLEGAGLSGNHNTTVTTNTTTVNTNTTTPTYTTSTTNTTTPTYTTSTTNTTTPTYTTSTTNTTTPTYTTSTTNTTTPTYTTSTTNTTTPTYTTSTTNTTTPTYTTSNTNSNNNTTSYSNTNTASGGNLVYKVQIGAFSAKPGKSQFPGLNVNVTEEGGMFKVTSGNFKTLDEAQRHKAELMNKGYSGFIVVYENGVRVKKF